MWHTLGVTVLKLLAIVIVLKVTKQPYVNRAFLKGRGVEKNQNIDCAHLLLLYTMFIYIK